MSQLHRRNQRCSRRHLPGGGGGEVLAEGTGYSNGSPGGLRCMAATPGYGFVGFGCGEDSCPDSSVVTRSSPIR